MSNNAWETTSATSLHPITDPFFMQLYFYLAPYNDVGDVVSQAVSLIYLTRILYTIIPI